MNVFFNSRRYVVVGASNNRYKFGYKVLDWYRQQGVTDVIPMHPTEAEIEGIKCIKSLSDLDLSSAEGPAGSLVSLSIITPPSVTLEILRSAFALSIFSIWIQPGAEDAAVRALVASQPEDVRSRVIFDCILVRGGEYLRKANARKAASL